MSNKGKCINQTRCGDVYMKIFDQSDNDGLKLVIESNAIKKCKFTTKVDGGNLSINGKYEETIGSTVNASSMAFDYALPDDIDVEKLKTTESADQIQIVAPRKK